MIDSKISGNDKWNVSVYPNSGLYKNVDEQSQVNYFVVDLESNCVFEIKRSCVEAITAQAKRTEPSEVNDKDSVISEKLLLKTIALLGNKVDVNEL